jgi:N4-gp56 family major capsid protein
MPNTGTEQVTAAVNAYLVKELLSRAYPYFVHVLWAEVKDLPRNAGETIKFRRYTNLTAATTALTQGVDPASEQLAITDVTASPLIYGNVITTTDFLDMTVIENLNMEIARLLGDNMGDTIDQLTRNVIQAGSTVQYASTATDRATITSGMKLNSTEIREAVRTLQGNNAKYITETIDPSNGFNTSPVPACFVGILSEDTLYDLEDDPDWVPYEEYAQVGRRLGDFEEGKIGRVRFVNAGSNAKTWSSTVTVHGTLIIGREFYGISRIAGEEMAMIVKSSKDNTTDTSNPLNLRSTAAWKITFVAKILNDNFGVRIEHAVSS